MKANQLKNLLQRNWVGLTCCLLALAGVLLVSCNATVSPSSFKVSGESVLNPGDIAFTAVIYNGDSQFSFVSTQNINAGVSIYFTNYSYDSTVTPNLVDESTNLNASASSVYPGIGSVTWANTVNGNGVTIIEGTVAYVVGSSGLPAYSPVVISNTSNAPDSLQGGSVVNIAGSGGVTYLMMNHNGAGQKILAYQPAGSVNNYVAAIIFGPDSWTTTGTLPQYDFWDSYLPPGLTNGVNATDLSALWNNTQTNTDNISLAQFNVNGTGSTANGQNQNAVLNSCQNTLAGIVNQANWQADGNEAKTKVCLTCIPVAGLSVCTNVGYTGLIP